MRRPSARTVALYVGALPLVLLLLLIAGWAIDSSVGGRQVGRNVSIAGRDVGGLSEDDLAPVVRDIADELANAKVELALPDTSINTTAGALGLRLDQQRTIDAAFEVDSGTALPLRPFNWAGSFFRSEDAPVAFSVSSTEVAAALTELEDRVRTLPTEPRIAFENGKVVAVPGKDGSALDPAQVAGELAKVREVTSQTIRVQVTPAAVPPTLDNGTAEKLAATVNEATERPIEGVLDDQSREIPGELIRPLVSSRVEQSDPKVNQSDLKVSLDQTKTLGMLAQVFDGVGTPPGEGELTIQGGRVVIEPGEPGFVCCGPEAVSVLAAALEDRRRSINLSLVEKQSTKDQAYYDKLGIVEKVSEFTTQHPAGQPRVTNIHNMADTIRGAVIAPGETFSINGYVGQRTRDKGYVSAPIIDGNGNFDEDVGGGVSQFATTMFNAAFFAGLDIPEYMAHGLYISRYPYGREATLSYPGPDLKITNITPYGILIWPSYSDTSITVELYSTRYIEAGQSGQSEEVYGKVCTTVTTSRLRTWLTTGEQRTDRFYALYGPEEGVQCDGSKVPKKGETTTTTATTVPGSSTTTVPGPSTSTSAGGSTTSTTAAGDTTTTTTTTAPTTSSTAASPDGGGGNNPPTGGAGTPGSGGTGSPPGSGG